MSGYSITSSKYLRDFYLSDRELTKKASREKASERTVSLADSKALRRALRDLENYDYGDGSKDDTDNEKSTLYKHLKAFADTYNYTMDSSSSSSSSGIKAMSKKMKQFSEKYADELEDLGITFDQKGYMSIKPSAVDNLKRSTYGKAFSATSDSKSDFLKDLEGVASKIYRRIDTIA